MKKPVSQRPLSFVPCSRVSHCKDDVAKSSLFLDQRKLVLFDFSFLIELLIALNGCSVDGSKGCVSRHRCAP